MLKKLLNYLKREIKLTKEYYRSNSASDMSSPSITEHDTEEVEMTYQGVTFMAPKPISNEEYQRRRQANEAWLEAHYDLNTAEGIQSIPERSDLPHPPDADSDGFRNYTCDIDYYLRIKSGEYEEVGNIELAILCLKKSNAIRMVSRRGYCKNDYYRLVSLLAQNGRLEEAKAEKIKIDRFFGGNDNDACSTIEPKVVKQIYDGAKQFETDLVIMSAHGASCPDCAKYQGRVFSLTGRDKRFPQIPSGISLYGGVHPGCGHTFSTYIHEVNDPMLEYTLSFQDNVKPQYKRNIVAFSNRPFVDDRLPDTIEKAREHAEKLGKERQQKLYYQAHVVEIEAQRGIDKRDYKWLQENLPDICPKSYSGYKRMKNGNTKNYQKLVAHAKELGRIIE